MTSISNWDDEYARVSRAASQLRTTTTNSTFQNYHNHASQNPSARQQQIRSVQTGLARLKSTLQTMRSQQGIGGGEYSRRMGLVDNLESQVGAVNNNSDGGQSNNHDGDLLGMNHGGSSSNYNNMSSGGGGGGGGGAQRLSTTAQALRHQDQMIDELASGVSRLKDQTLMVNDEANMQNRMLDDVSGIFIYFCLLLLLFILLMGLLLFFMNF